MVLMLVQITAIYTNNMLEEKAIPLSCVITGSTGCASLMTATSNIITISSDSTVKPEIYVYPDRI